MHKLFLICLVIGQIAFSTIAHSIELPQGLYTFKEIKCLEGGPISDYMLGFEGTIDFKHVGKAISKENYKDRLEIQIIRDVQIDENKRVKLSNPDVYPPGNVVFKKWQSFEVSTEIYEPRISPEGEQQLVLVINHTLLKERVCKASKIFEIIYVRGDIPLL